MPYRRKYGRYAKKAGYKRTAPKKARSARSIRRRSKYASPRKALSLRSKWVTPLANTKLIRFTYNDTGFSSSWTTGQSLHVYRGNSCYDPDSTGVGVQPYGWDQWTPGLFTQYRVTSSKITIYFNTDAYEDACPAIKAYIIPQLTDTLAYQDPSDLGRSKFCKQVVWNQGDDTRKLKIKNFCKSKWMRPTVSISDNNQIAVYDANPNLQWYWLVIFDTTDWAPETDPSIQYDVKIVYYTQLTKPPQLNDS